MFPRRKLVLKDLLQAKQCPQRKINEQRIAEDDTTMLTAAAKERKRVDDLRWVLRIGVSIKMSKISKGGWGLVLVSLFTE